MTHRLLLVGETPRAGEFNYRFFASSGGVTEESARRLVDAASDRLRGAESTLIGPDFLGVVERDVRQKHGGRKANEVLVLAGVDTSKADTSKLLQKLLILVHEWGEAVQKTTDGKMLVIQHPPFDQWIVDHGADIPRRRIVSGGTRCYPGSASKIRKMVLSLLLLLAGLLIGVIVLAPNLFTRKSPSPSSFPEGSQPDSGPSTVVASNAKPSATSKDAFFDKIRTLHQNPNPSPSDEDIETDARQIGLDWEGNLDSLLEQLNSLATYDPRSPFGLHANEAALQEARQIPDLHQRVIEFRQSLFLHRTMLKDLREKARTSLLSQNTFGRDYPTLILLSELAKPKTYALLDQGIPPKQILPWFSADDVKTANLLAEFYATSYAGRDLQRAQSGSPRVEWHDFVTSNNLSRKLINEFDELNLVWTNYQRKCDVEFLMKNPLWRLLSSN